MFLTPLTAWEMTSTHSEEDITKQQLAETGIFECRLFSEYVIHYFYIEGHLQLAIRKLPFQPKRDKISELHCQNVRIAEVLALWTEICNSCFKRIKSEL